MILDHLWLGGGGSNVSALATCITTVSVDVFTWELGSSHTRPKFYSSFWLDGDMTSLELDKHWPHPGFFESIQCRGHHRCFNVGKVIDSH